MVRGCAILGCIFYDRVRIYGYRFQQLLHFPDLWVWFFVKIHLLVSYLGISGFMGMTFRIFSGFMGGTLYDLNCTTPYIGNSTDHPGISTLLKKKVELCRKKPFTFDFPAP